MKYSDVIDAWSSEPEFCQQFSLELANCSFSAFRWETPPLSQSNHDRLFEFVLLDSPRLERNIDQRAFADHFDTNEIVCFPNLRGDATLVVPCPTCETTHYGHLASFLRTAPVSQSNGLWRRIGLEMSKRIDGEPIWLSTAGMGVSWLHVRLDSTPKYYGHAEYKNWPFAQ